MTTTTYHPFNPPRRPEEFVGIAGPYGGLALPHDVLAAIAEARATKQPHEYLVRGEWVRDYGVRFLDVSIDLEWVMAKDPNYQLINGRLRWVCPGCGYMSSNHKKGCGYR
jgi:hypothetical protein